MEKTKNTQTWYIQNQFRLKLNNGERMQIPIQSTFEKANSILDKSEFVNLRNQ